LTKDYNLFTIINERTVIVVNKNLIKLTPRDILEKEFKIDTRGYCMQEVDRFLDVIIKDYEEMNTIIKNLAKEKQELVEDNIGLKQEVRNLRTKLDVLSDSNGEGSSNADVLRRLSNLEKYIYSKD
jgi:DivIVA domain-containing protein